MKSQQLLPKGEVLQEEFFSGAKDGEDPAEQMSKAHKHQGIIAKSALGRGSSKSLILRLCRVLARHRHEISQSAGFLNWAKDYPYLYIHVDITFDFLTVLAEYDRITGDQAFLSRHWPATLKAYQYCLSTLDKGD
ncbi:MAG TPA: hypothetical protein VII23_22490, partial [Terriglobales bacterium]